MATREYLESTAFNLNIRKFWMKNWLWNAAMNLPTIRKLYFRYGKEIDFLSFPKPGLRPDGLSVPAVILGSGPSFDKALPYLPGFPGPIFSSPSANLVLMALGRHADFILALDTTTRVVDQFSDDIEWCGSTIVTHPSMCPDFFKHWKAKRDLKLFRMWEPDNETLSTLYDSIYPYIQARVVNSGCVVNNSILLANGMGFNPLFIVGADFGYPKPTDLYSPAELLELVRPKLQGIKLEDAPKELQDRFAKETEDWNKLAEQAANDPSVLYNLKGYPKIHLDKGLLRFRDFVGIGKHVYEPREYDWTDLTLDPTLQTSDNNIWTTATNIFYKHTFVCNWKLGAMQLINCSKGILNDVAIPQMEFYDVMQKGGLNIASKPGDPLWMTPEKIDEVADAYLIPRGLYAKRGPQGQIQGVELVDGLKMNVNEAKAKYEIYKTLQDKWSYNEEKKEWQRERDAPSKLILPGVGKSMAQVSRQAFRQIKK